MPEHQHSLVVGAVSEVVCTAAGLADVAIGQVTHLLRDVARVLRRSDLLDLTRDGHDEVKARGSLIIKRHTPNLRQYLAPSEPHAELLAQAAIRRASADA